MNRCFRLVSALFASSLCSAGGISLTGVVTDATGRPVPGASVTLVVAGCSALTDSEGGWSLGTTASTEKRKIDVSQNIRGALFDHGRSSVRFDGFDAVGRSLGQVAPSVPARSAGRRLDAVIDTLVFRWRSKVVRQPVSTVYTTAVIATTLDTTGAARLEVRTTRFQWAGFDGSGIGVSNHDTKGYDSLRIRLFLKGKAPELADFAVRADIAINYLSSGYLDTAMFSVVKGFAKSRPKLLDPGCSASADCMWSFDLPLEGAILEPQGRLRLDLLFDRHLLIRDSTEVLNESPTHRPFAGADWSFRSHTAGADNGFSPVAYPGVPLADKEDLDRNLLQIPVNPYIAIYRGNDHLYGYEPSSR